MLRLSGETSLTGGTWVGDYGGVIMCLPCIHERYPNEIWQYVSLVFTDDDDYYYIDSAITAVGGRNRLLQKSEFGKMRIVNSSRRPGKHNVREAKEPNCEFVGVELDQEGDLVLEVRVKNGKTVSPGDEILISYDFPSTEELVMVVCSSSCCVTCVATIILHFFCVQGCTEQCRGPAPGITNFLHDDARFC